MRRAFWRMEGDIGVCGWVLCLALLAGCQATPRVDTPADAAGAAGVGAGIIVQNQGEPIDIPDQAGKALTEDEALARVLMHDPRIQSALAKVRVAQSEAEQAQLLPNPILNLDRRFAEGGGQGVFEITLASDLIAVLQKPKQVSAANQRLRSASAEAVTTVLDILAEAQESYVGVQSTEAHVAILEERSKIVERLLGVAKARLQAGEGIRLDVLTLDAQRVGLAVEVAQRRVELRQQRLALARLIGEPSGAADWQLGPWQAPAAVKSDESAWLKAALEKRPEISARRWELGALGDEVKLTTLSPLEGGEVGAHGEHDVTWAVGPTVTTPLPFFDWGQAKRRKAEAQRLAVRHELTQLQRQVVEEVRRAYAAYVESWTTLQQAQNELMPLQEKRREQAELSYKSGEADLTTLLLAEADLQDAKAKLVELRQKVTVALLKLRRAVGGAGIASEVEAGAQQ